jgi:hypothetical protein
MNHRLAQSTPSAPYRSRLHQPLSRAVGLATDIATAPANYAGRHDKTSKLRASNQPTLVPSTTITTAPNSAAAPRVSRTTQPRRVLQPPTSGSAIIDSRGSNPDAPREAPGRDTTEKLRNSAWYQREMKLKVEQNPDLHRSPQPSTALSYSDVCPTPSLSRGRRATVPMSSADDRGRARPSAAGCCWAPCFVPLPGKQVPDQ